MIAMSTDEKIDEIYKRVVELQNEVDFLIKLCLRLETRFIGLGTSIESCINPSIDYDEEETIIQKLKEGAK